MDDKELQLARENVAKLQAQKQQVDILLTKWVGIVEYLTVKAEDAAKAKVASEKPEPKKPKDA
jgi:hypothetical protein